MHADIGAHRRTTAVTMRFARQLLPTNAEGRIRRGVLNAGKLRHGGNDRVDHVVKLSPVHFAVFDGAVQ